MNKKKFLFILLLIIVFFLGFAIHALFFPTILSRNYTLDIKHSIDKKDIKNSIETNPAQTIVTFENGEFNPRVVVIGKSYYVGIRNMSDTELMTLTSLNPLFQTPRGYGKSEELLVQLYDVGEYFVSSALHPDKVLKVIVK